MDAAVSSSCLFFCKLSAAACLTSECMEVSLLSSCFFFYFDFYNRRVESKGNPGSA